MTEYSSVCQVRCSIIDVAGCNMEDNIARVSGFKAVD